jgi:dihydroxyacetone kinase-like protein
MGAALTGCMVPAANRPTFSLAENEMEMGVGIHGEAGRKRMEIMNARDIVHQLAATIGADLSIRRGDPILLHVNGLGGTPLMELYLIYHLAEKFCRDNGWNVVRSLVGNHTTSLEMAGCSVTVSVLEDDLLELWDAPVHTPSLRWGN